MDIAKYTSSVSKPAKMMISRVNLIRAEYGNRKPYPLGNLPSVDQHSHQCDTLSLLVKGQNLLDHDKEFLAKELTKLSKQYQQLLHTHSRKIAEEKKLNQVIEKLQIDLDQRDDNLVAIQMDTEKYSTSSQKLKEDISSYKQRYLQAAKSNIEMKDQIIVLQQRVMDLHECKKYNEKLQSKNEELTQQIRSLTIAFDYERSNTERLSKTVRVKDNEIQESQKSRKEFYALKFQLSKANEDIAEYRSTIEELKKSSVALSGRHDELKKQKINESIKVTKKEQLNSDLQRQITSLETELKCEKLALETSKRQNKRLKEESQMYREQIECHNKEMDIAISERDQAIKEKDEAMRYYREIQKSRDEATRKQVDINNRLKSTIADLTEELGERDID